MFQIYSWIIYFFLVFSPSSFATNNQRSFSNVDKTLCYIGEIDFLKKDGWGANLDQSKIVNCQNLQGEKAYYLVSFAEVVNKSDGTVEIINFSKDNINDELNVRYGENGYLIRRKIRNAISRYTRENKKIYYNNIEVPGVNTDTFKVISGEPRERNHGWCGTSIDRNSFVKNKLVENAYAKDDKNFYWSGYNINQVIDNCNNVRSLTDFDIIKVLMSYKSKKENVLSLVEGLKSKSFCLDIALVNYLKDPYRLISNTNGNYFYRSGKSYYRSRKTDTMLELEDSEGEPVYRISPQIVMGKHHFYYDGNPIGNLRFNEIMIDIHPEIGPIDSWKVVFMNEKNELFLLIPSLNEAQIYGVPMIEKIDFEKLQVPNYRLRPQGYGREFIYKKMYFHIRFNQKILREVISQKHASLERKLYMYFSIILTLIFAFLMFIDKRKK